MTGSVIFMCEESVLVKIAFMDTINLEKHIERHRQTNRHTRRDTHAERTQERRRPTRGKASTSLKGKLEQILWVSEDD